MLSTSAGCWPSGAFCDVSVHVHRLECLDPPEAIFLGKGLHEVGARNATCTGVILGGRLVLGLDLKEVVLLQWRISMVETDLTDALEGDHTESSPLVLRSAGKPLDHHHHASRAAMSPLVHTGNRTALFR